MALSTSTEPVIDLPTITAAPGGATTTVVGFDPEDPDASPWTVTANPTRSAMLAGNEVIPYIRSDKLFPDIVAAIRTATSGQHFIWIVGWNLSDATTHGGPGTGLVLVPGDATTSILNLFTTADTAGVRIRMMLFRHDTASNARDNSELVAFVQGLPNGMAVLDDRVVVGAGSLSSYIPGAPAGAHYVGSHHQKIIVVSGSEGLVAFQGGYDLDADRISLGGGPGLHDVHSRIRGPSAKSLAEAIRERWNDRPGLATAQLLPVVATQPTFPDDKSVQIAHTFPNPNKHAINGGVAYGFAPAGEITVKQLLLKAISTARQFIYVEDQYLFDMDISNALRAALPNIQKLLILIVGSGSIEAETLQPWARRKAFIDNLPASYTVTPASAGPPPTAARATYTGKVAVCQLASQYVHAKTWIFDDKFAVIASANVNRRGMSHDSEQAAGIYDPNHARRWFFAHELRMNLWGKHFRRPPIDFRDPLASSVHWFTPIGDVIPYNPDGGTDTDPKGLNKLGLTGLTRAAVSLILTNNLVWDSIVDPDGT